MRKKRKVIILLIILIVIGGIITGGYFAFQWYQDNNLIAEVVSVSELNWYYGEEEMASEGIVTNDSYQEVYLIEDQTVAEVLVKEGQEVKAGEPLFAYDTTLTDMELEMQQIEIESTRNQLVMANRELEELRNTTPVEDTDLVPEPEEEPEVPKQIDEKTKAYYYISGDTNTKKAKTKGKGTPEEPYIILCMPGCYVEGGYLNALSSSEKAICVRLQIINPKNNRADKDKFWEINSKQFNGMTFEEDSRWSVETKQPVYEEDEFEEFVDEEMEEEYDEPEGYTASELAAQIREVQSEIKELNLEIRKAELELEQMKRVSENGVVTATIDGVVKSIGDKDEAMDTGEPFLTVSGSEGLYVTGNLSELQLLETKVGQTIYGNSWDSGKSFEATIKEISIYPAESANTWGEGNPNVSYYPYIAYIEDSEGLNKGEYVSLTMTPMSEDMMESDVIYLMKAYLREENGRSYVLLADENERLKKQYVETGKTLYGEAVEIKSGLTQEDRLAFPYGKKAKEGLKVKDAEDFGMYY